MYTRRKTATVRDDEAVIKSAKDITSNRETALSSKFFEIFLVVKILCHCSRGGSLTPLFTFEFSNSLLSTMEILSFMFALKVHSFYKRFKHIENLTF